MNDDDLQIPVALRDVAFMSPISLSCTLFGFFGNANTYLWVSFHTGEEHSLVIK